MKIKEKLLKKMVEQHIISYDKYEIYDYGLSIFFIYLANIALSFFISTIFGNFKIYLLTIIFFIPLRLYVGGFHFDNAKLCCLSSQLILFIPQFIFTKINHYNFFCSLNMVLFYILLLLLTATKGVVCSRKRNFNANMTHRLKKISLSIEFFYIILFFFFYVFNKELCIIALNYVILLQLVLILIPEQ